MREMIIIFGPMGAGKTEYAKRLAKETGYTYMSFDDLFSRMFGGKFEPFLNYLVTRMDEEKINAVLDGWFVWDEKQTKSVEKIEAKAKATWIHLFIPRWLAEKRIEQKDFDVRGSLELSFERTSPDNAKCECRILDATDFEYGECSREEYDERVSEEPTMEKVKKFLQEIRGYEPYHNIRLPFGLTTKGYTDCERSWERIRPLVDWKGKTVLDLGCYWGYFCFKIKGEGAKEVTGTDISDDAVETARRIRSMKEADVIFKRHDMEHENIDAEYDIILLLNTLHHLRSPFHVLRKAFGKSENVVIEVELPHDGSLRGRPTVEMGDPIKISGSSMGGHLRFSREMLMRFASENGHFLKDEVQSARPNRTILLFGRE